MKRSIMVMGVAAVLLALGGMGRAEALPSATLELPEIVTQSGSNVEIPIYATADQVMSATLVFTFNPLMFVEGINGITVNAPAWLTQNPVVEPEGTPIGENLYDNVFVDYNMDSIEETDYLIVAVASSDARSFYGEPLITISGQLIGNLAGNVMALAWSAADVEINGEPVSVLTDGFIEVNDPPVWQMASTGNAIVGIAMEPIPVLAVDPEGLGLTYQIVSGGGEWVTLAGTALNGVPPIGSVGTTVVELMASDGVNDVYHDVTITVAPNLPPMWIAPPEVVDAVEYQEVEIPLAATDPEAQQLSYELVTGPEWLSIDGAALYGMPEGADIGPTNVQVEVFDGINAVPYTFAINVALYFGDVTENGGISALDASQILKWVVKKIASIDLDRADVSREEYSEPVAATSWDAALILYKVVNPGYLFPVQGGFSPLDGQLIPEKFAVSTPASLEWVRTSDGWALNASGVGPMGADLVLQMPESASLSSDAMFDYARDGEVVTIAAAAIDGGELFRVNGTSSAPEVVSATLNGAEAMVAVPMSFELRQNTPNPFNPSTTIAFSLPESAPVTLAIYDVNGRMVRTLVSGERGAGLHEVVWNGMDDNGRAVASGVYVYRLAAGNDVSTRRLALIR